MSVIGHSLGSVLMFDLLKEKAERDRAMEAMSRGIPTDSLPASVRVNGRDGEYDEQNNIGSCTVINELIVV